MPLGRYIDPCPCVEVANKILHTGYAEDNATDGYDWPTKEICPYIDCHTTHGGTQLNQRIDEI